MNIHEYQAKKILADYGVKIPAGQVAYTPKEALAVAGNISKSGPWVLKAQIQSGARQSGYFLEKEAGEEGGIRKVTDKRRIAAQAQQMLGKTLVTIQTGAAGKRVNKIYIEAFQKVKQIFYMAITIDRIAAEMVLLAANVSDGDILSLAINQPQKILHLPLSNDDSITADQIDILQKFLHLPRKAEKNLQNFVCGLQKVFWDLDASMIEINPVGVDTSGQLWALDAKITFDDNGLCRHPEIAALKDECSMDDLELQASRYKFTYHEFNGAVGCVVNGDGIALSAMDLLKEKGSGASCFINVKGGVDKDKIAAGIKIIMTNPRVEGILLNILGGFVRCNLIADGIIAAASEVGLNVPMVIRFEGTNKDIAKEILDNSHLPIVWADTLEDAVDKLLGEMERAV